MGSLRNPSGVAGAQRRPRLHQEKAEMLKKTKERAKTADGNHWPSFDKPTPVFALKDIALTPVQ